MRRHLLPPTREAAQRQASAGARDGVKGQRRTLAARAPLHALVRLRMWRTPPKRQSVDDVNALLPRLAVCDLELDGVGVDPVDTHAKFSTLCIYQVIRQPPIPAPLARGTMTEIGLRQPSRWRIDNSHLWFRTGVCVTEPRPREG